MAFQSKGIISLKVRITYCFKVLLTPLQESLVPHRLALSAFALVVGTYILTEVFTVGEVEGDSVGIEPFLENVDLSFKDLQNLFKVAGNRDEIISPIKFSFSGLTSTVGVEVSVYAEMGVSGIVTNCLPLSLRTRAEL